MRCGSSIRSRWRCSCCTRRVMPALPTRAAVTRARVGSVIPARRAATESKPSTPSVRQDDPWEAPAECDSARHENEGMRKHFEDEERSGGVRAQASHVVSLPDRGCTSHNGWIDTRMPWGRPAMKSWPLPGASASTRPRTTGRSVTSCCRSVTELLETIRVGAVAKRIVLTYSQGRHVHPGRDVDRLYPARNRG
ncbi:MAG: hypothetical protein ACI9VR_002029 [Cognaticolwellia sp.]|jgi:hypothetical protein